LVRPDLISLLLNHWLHNSGRELTKGSVKILKNTSTLILRERLKHNARNCRGYSPPATHCVFRLHSKDPQTEPGSISDCTSITRQDLKSHPNAGRSIGCDRVRYTFTGSTRVQSKQKGLRCALRQPLLVIKAPLTHLHRTLQIHGPQLGDLRDWVHAICEGDAISSRIDGTHCSTLGT